MSTIKAPAVPTQFEREGSGQLMCRCMSDKYGPVYCDAHRPLPPPPPEGACVLCHRIEPAADLFEGRGGMKCHAACARD